MAGKDPALDERAEEDAIASAIADTEEEIFNAANGKEDPENDGDKSLEEMEDPLGEEPDESEEVEASEDDDGEPEGEEPEGERRDERETARVPSYRVREEREARERAEREAVEWKARYEESQRHPQQVQPPQPPPERPDLFGDPDKWIETTESGLLKAARQAAREEFVNLNLAATHEEFGREFTFAYDALVAGKDDPAIQREAQRILAAPNPGRALMRWAEPRLEAFREQETERLQEDAARLGLDLVPQRSRPSVDRPTQGSQRPRGPVPPSLNSAGGSGGVRQRLDPRGQDGSEQAIFADAFTPLR